MKLFFLLSSALVLYIQTCKKTVNTQDQPSSCLKDKINSFQKQNNCASAHVDEMNFQSKTVYVFDPGNCGADMTKDVINTDCKVIGSLGGITGNTKINSTEFATAKFVQTVWSRN